MIRRVVLHGYLRDLVPGGIVEVHAETPREAVKEMCARHKDAFRPDAKNGRHLMSIVDFDTPELLDWHTDKEEIHIVPPFMAGKSLFLRILIGAVLIAASFIDPIVGITWLANAMLGFGVSLVLGGVLELLMPQPKIDTNSSETDNSRYLGAPGNTVRVGTRIPIGFGRYKIYGQILSYNVTAGDFSVGTVDVSPTNTIVGGDATYWGGIFP